MSDTSIQLDETKTFVDDNGNPFKIGAHSDVTHGFYTGAPPWTQDNENDAWVININAKNGVVDAGRRQIPGKILLRNGEQEVKLILDGATGEIQQAGDITTQGDVLVIRNAKIMVRLDGDNGDLLLGGGTPMESRIWLQSHGGNAFLGGNIRLEGGAGRATLGKPTPGGSPGANGSLALNNSAGSSLIQLAGENGNGQFGGSVSIGTTAAFSEQLHVEGKTVVAGNQAELLVAGKAGIGTTTSHNEQLHVEGKTVVAGNQAELLVAGRAGIGTTVSHDEQFHVAGKAVVGGNEAELIVTGKVSVGSTESHDEKLHVTGKAMVNGPGAELVVNGNMSVGATDHHSERLYVDGSTRVGGPGARLDVDGPTRVAGTGAALDVVGPTTLGGAVIVKGETSLQEKLITNKSVGVGAPPEINKGTGIQVSDPDFASTAVRVGVSHVGLGVDKAGADMIYWDPVHDLTIGTRSNVDGSGDKFERQVMKATSEGKVFVGGIELDGVRGDVLLPNADCAEDFDIADSEELEPGTVVVIEDEGKLVQSRMAYDRRVAGVISGAGQYRPGIVLDQRRDSPDKRMPVALMGKVYCKVDADLSPIEVGDLLTPASTAGHAMKATDRARSFGAVIGKALRALPSGKGLIPVLVALQ